MPSVRLAAVSINQTPLDWEGNRARLIASIDAARQAGAVIACLPELTVTGYGCEDAFFSPGVRRLALESLAELLPHTRGIAVPLGIPLEAGGRLYNACAFVCDGVVRGVVCKQHLAGDGIHYEPRWFHPWPAGKIASLRLLGEEVPVGELLFDWGGVRIGFEICRDAWVVDRIAPRLAAKGAQVILNPSASHFAFGKHEIRRGFALAAARDHGVVFVYANLLGNESGRAIYDGGGLIASNAKLVAEGPRFSFADHVLTVADVPLAADGVGTKSPLSAIDGLVSCQGTLLGPERPVASSAPPSWDGSPPSKHEEFSRAVALGLFDYLRKSRAGGLVVSLSGGADSAAVSTFVWLMFQFAVRELGRRAVLARLPDVKTLHQLAPMSDQDVSGLVHSTLCCVYQATRQSGEVTREAAAIVAHMLDAEFHSWNVDEFVDGYVAVVSQAVGRALDWKHDDVALQNIQARARGPGVWLLANLRSALLLATSNRSEAAVGYATMDGDTCGGLAPIAGIDKAYLLEWLQWMETAGPTGVGPLPRLAVVNRQRPTAELRPAAFEQTDEADLMPYRALDLIERAAIRDRLLPGEVYEAVLPTLAEFSPETVREWVERFFRLWRQNQWKRERYAPSFHLDDENLDPKTWCRFPILSGGLQRELADLYRAPSVDARSR